MARRTRLPSSSSRVVVLEIHGVQGLDQRQVEDAEIDRGIVALVAVIVPGVMGRQHHVAGPEGDVLALDAGEVHGAGEAEADRIRANGDAAA